MRKTRLRRRLLLIAAVAIVPLAVVAGIAIETLIQRQLEQTEASALNLARAIATSVDNELRLTVSGLQSLALTDPFAAESEAGLIEARTLALNALQARPEWSTVLLATPAGEVVMSTAVPPGTPARRVTETASLASVLKTSEPAIGPLTVGSTGTRGIPVRVPVLRDGAMRYVLTAVLKPEAIVAVVNRQRIPDDWTVSVFDANRIRVARSRDQAAFFATRPSDSLLALMERLQTREETYGPTSTMEGEDVNTAVSRLKSARWTVTLGVPRSVSESAFRRSVLVFGGGIVLSVLLGALAAFVASRRIEQAIAGLRGSAEALGRGEPVRPVESGIAEIEATSIDLVAAAERRAQVERERERLLSGERESRAVAERAQRRLQLLASAGSALSQSLEEAQALAAIAASIVPDVADLCRIDLLDGDGVLERKLTHHRDPQRQTAISSWVSRSAASAATPGTFPYAIATGQTFVAHFDDEVIARITDPGVSEFIRLAGVRAACVLPLVARGRTIGAMAVIQAESERRFEADDVALVVEISRRAALALDNVRLFAESRDALARAQSAGRVKDEFLAMLGHELRNPLAPIVTSLEVMARRDATASNTDAPERRVIERQVKHLSRLVDDLLDVSRIAAGKIDLHLQPVDLREVVERALELARPALAGRFAPPVVTRPDAPVWVDGDPVRLAQVASNLIANAAKYSGPSARIEIGLRRDAGGATLAVRDEGDGIAPELLPHVFERFVQGDQSLQRARGGLGLGLAIVRNIVELHGGRVTAESQGPGHGSCFTVRLPTANAPATAADATTAAGVEAGAAPSTASPRARRILVVDDNEDAAQALTVLLELEGHEVRAAGSGGAALALLDGFVPEAAILDIGLPDMNGYELARALRADPRTASVRLVALTGYGRLPDRQLAAEAGFDRHLVKPAELDDLLAALQPDTRPTA